MTNHSKVLKSGISKALVCRKCGHRVGFVKLKQKANWQVIKWAIGLGLLFEFISNLIIYFIFK